MVALIIYGLIIAGAIGAVIRVAMHFLHEDYQISKQEYPIFIPVLVLLTVITSVVGYKISVNNNVTYNEFWGGFEAAAVTTVYQCHESEDSGGSTGGCVHTYDADSYQVWVVSQDCQTDDKGNRQCTDTSHYETRWRQVPYTDTETDYTVITTLGNYSIGEHWLPTNPWAHRIHPAEDSPDALNTSLPSGIPSFWQAVLDRVNSGQNGPVTAEKTYANYILASQSTILHKYSPWITQYQKAGILPDIQHNIQNVYYMDRVYTVGGVNIGDKAAWQSALNRFDAALGTDLTGDLYFVVVPSDKVSDPYTYLMSVAAYWESPKFGKYAISKNGIIVVVGTKDGKTIDWAQATTGMPSGNELMLLDIQHKLPGTQLTPDAVFGSPKASIRASGNSFQTTINHTNGVLEQVIWGQDKFQRVHMNSGPTGGYLYLKGEIKPSSSQLTWILVVSGILSAIAWGVAFAYGVPYYKNRNNK